MRTNRSRRLVKGSVLAHWRRLFFITLSVCRHSGFLIDFFHVLHAAQCNPSKSISWGKLRRTLWGKITHSSCYPALWWDVHCCGLKGAFMRFPLQTSNRMREFQTETCNRFPPSQLCSLIELQFFCFNHQRTDPRPEKLVPAPHWAGRTNRLHPGLEAELPWPNLHSKNWAVAAKDSQNVENEWSR